METKGREYLVTVEVMLPSMSSGEVLDEFSRQNFNVRLGDPNYDIAKIAVGIKTTIDRFEKHQRKVARAKLKGIQ